MARNSKKGQKKLGEKAKKRNIAKMSPGSVLSKNKALRYGRFPIHECLISNGLSDMGLRTIIMSRRGPQNVVAVSVFIVDTFCLGVKNALFKVQDIYDYKSTFKPHLIITHEGQIFEDIDPACARKFIEGATAYAEALEFPPHRDYKNAINIFGDIDGSDCSEEYTYGKDGKPFYINGPHESPGMVRYYPSIKSKMR